MRPVHDPYGGVNPLIDKMIGNAYDVVRYVARYLKEIRYLAENMSTVYEAVNGNKVFLSGTPEVGASSLGLALPEDLDIADIAGISILAYNSTSNLIYTAGPDTFDYGVSGTQVQISFNDANSDLTTAVYKAMITLDMS